MSYSWGRGDPRPYSQQFEYLVDVLNGDVELPADGLTELDLLAAELVDYGRRMSVLSSNPYLTGRPAPTARRNAVLTLLDRIRAWVRRSSTDAPRRGAVTTKPPA